MMRFTCMALVLIITLGFSSLWAQDNEDIVETVYVENVRIPVRVFDGKQPVKGLTKEDFTLFINGRKTPINGFFEVSRKLAPLRRSGETVTEETADTAPPAPGRLFVLIFNLSDYRMDMAGHMDMVFKEIIRPRDRVMVITNRFFLPEWEVTNPDVVKGRIMGILEKEAKIMKGDMVRFTNELRSNAARLKSRMADPAEMKINDYPAHIFKDFFFHYQFVLEDLKDQYLALPVAQYVKIAEYLKGQQAEKWVLNFYQLGRLPLLDKMGTVQREIDRVIGQDGGGGGGGGLGGYTIDRKAARQNTLRVYFDFINSIREGDDVLVRDIGKAFLNSGATFHTLLLKPVSIDFSGDYKYETVSTEAENILKKLAHMTGGSVVRSNRIADFMKDAAAREDVIYTLTYVPDRKKKKNPDIEIKTAGRGYRVVYDDQKRIKAFRQVMKDLTRELKDLEIASIACSAEWLTVKVVNMEMAQYEGEYFGAVRAKVKIMDKRSRTVAGFEKTYKGIKAEGVFRAKLPELAAGRYKVVLEVKDLFSLKNVYVGDAVNVTIN